MFHNLAEAAKDSVYIKLRAYLLQGCICSFDKRTPSDCEESKFFNASDGSSSKKVLQHINSPCAVPMKLFVERFQDSIYCQANFILNLHSLGTILNSIKLHFTFFPVFSLFFLGGGEGDGWGREGGWVGGGGGGVGGVGMVVCNSLLSCSVNYCPLSYTKYIFFTLDWSQNIT